MLSEPTAHRVHNTCYQKVQHSTNMWKIQRLRPQIFLNLEQSTAIMFSRNGLALIYCGLLRVFNDSLCTVNNGN